MAVLVPTQRRRRLDPDEVGVEFDRRKARRLWRPAGCAGSDLPPTVSAVVDLDGGVFDRYGLLVGNRAVQRTLEGLVFMWRDQRDVVSSSLITRYCSWAYICINSSADRTGFVAERRNEGRAPTAFSRRGRKHRP